MLYFFPGNTPLHLAMDSAHAEAAVVLINAGADRTRVRFPYHTSHLHHNNGLIDAPYFTPSRKISMAKHQKRWQA